MSSIAIVGAMLLTLLQCASAIDPQESGAPVISIAHVDGAAVSKLRAGDIVRLDLGAPGVFRAKTQAVQTVENGRIVWSGTVLDLESRPGDATLVIAGDRVTGSVRTGGGKLYRISPTATGNKGELVDPAAMGAD